MATRATEGRTSSLSKKSETQMYGVAGAWWPTIGVGRGFGIVGTNHPSAAGIAVGRCIRGCLFPKRDSGDD